MRRGVWLDWALVAVLAFGMVWEGRWAVMDFAHSHWSHGLARLLFALILLAVGVASCWLRTSKRSRARPE